MIEARAAVADRDMLVRRYGTRDASPKRDTFGLYRIIGDDLVPRHRKGPRYAADASATREATPG